MRLPAPAQIKLDRFQQQSADAQALAAVAKNTCDLTRASLLDQKQRLNTLAEGDPQRKAVLVEIDALKSRLERQEADYNQRRTDAANAAQIAARLTQWLEKNGHKQFVVHVHKPKVKGGVDDIRAELAAVVAEIRQVQTTRLDNATLKQQADELVQRLADAVRPSVTGFDGLRVAQRDGVALELSAFEKQLGLQCWLNPAAVSRALHRDIDAMSGAGLSAADKAAKLAELSTQALELQRAEEFACERDGTARRVDADPLALLGITPAPKAQPKAA